MITHTLRYGGLTVEVDVEGEQVEGVRVEGTPYLDELLIGERGAYGLPISPHVLDRDAHLIATLGPRLPYPEFDKFWDEHTALTLTPGFLN